MFSTKLSHLTFFLTLVIRHNIFKLCFLDKLMVQKYLICNMIFKHLFFALFLIIKISTKRKYFLNNRCIGTGVGRPANSHGFLYNWQIYPYQETYSTKMLSQTSFLTYSSLLSHIKIYIFLLAQGQRDKYKSKVGCKLTYIFFTVSMYMTWLKHFKYTCG